MAQIFKIIFLLVGFLGATLGSYSQSKLSLSEAINIALKQNFDIQLAKNRVEIAKTSNSFGVAGGLPTINGTASDQEQIQNIVQETGAGTRTANGALGNTLAMNITGSLVLFNGMRIIATKQRLSLLEKQNQEQLNAQIQNTIANVMAAYFNIIRQQSYANTLQKSIEVSDSKLQIINQQLKLGLSNNAIVFQAEVDLNTLQQNLIEQKLAIQQAYNDFQLLLNYTDNQEFIIEDSISIDTTLQFENLESFFKNNPEILSASMQLKINEQLLKETASQRYPTLRLNGGYNYNRAVSNGGFFLLNQSNGPFVSLTLNVPIYNGNNLKKQQDIAKINLKNAELQKQSIEKRNLSIAQKMWSAYQSSLERLAIGEKNYKLAAQLLELVSKKFELRQATVIDLKMAQQSFENAAYSISNLKYAAKMAEIELKRMAVQLNY